MAVPNKSYKFTPCGATINRGPTQTQVDAAYASTLLAGKVTSQSGIQLWTVPETGKYVIEACGAQGGASGYGQGGKGAKMMGAFVLQAGTQLKILVGQKGKDSCSWDGSGGGGTFVVKSDGTPLVIAGGGGGSCSDGNGTDGVTTIRANANKSNTGTPGDNGNGATSAGWAAGGGGFLSRSTNSPNASLYAPGFNEGGGGGIGYSGFNGGFGCGGGTHGGGWGGGGGGGYSGGPSANNWNLGGGGGGSFNSGIEQANVSGFKTGDGEVNIYFYNMTNAFFLDEGKIYTLQGGIWVDTGLSSPTKADFDLLAIKDLSGVLVGNDRYNLSFTKDLQLNDGYLFRYVFDIQKYKKIKSLSIASGIKDFGTYRAWADGTYAKSAKEYRFPTSGHTYVGDIGDGVYRIAPDGVNTIDVYCDMTTDGGGWALAFSPKDENKWSGYNTYNWKTAHHKRLVKDCIEMMVYIAANNNSTLYSGADKYKFNKPTDFEEIWTWGSRQFGYSGQPAPGLAKATRLTGTEAQKKEYNLQWSVYSGRSFGSTLTENDAANTTRGRFGIYNTDQSSFGRGFFLASFALSGGVNLQFMNESYAARTMDTSNFLTIWTR